MYNVIYDVAYDAGIDHEAKVDGRSTLLVRRESSQCASSLGYFSQ